MDLFISRNPSKQSILTDKSGERSAKALALLFNNLLNFFKQPKEDNLSKQQ